MNPFTFACPICRGKLTAVSQHTLHCPIDQTTFLQIEDIWRFLPPNAFTRYKQFMRDYETIRRAEGRSSTHPATYRALPFNDLTGQRTADWHIRAQSFLTLLQKVITPLESDTPLKILDVGAGSGWLANRLAQRGHAVAAVDLLTNNFDGLGVHAMYESTFTPVQAEFDRLPFPDNEADLLIFNASFHYSVDYAKTLQESWRVLRPAGRVVIVDTAVYHNPASGRQMVQEREAHFLQTYGFASNALSSQNFLTYRQLEELAQQRHIHWQLYWPTPRWQWTIRRWRTALRRQREPGQLPLIVGKR